MALNLTKWKKNWKLMQQIFETDEIQKIKSQLKSLQLENVVYCSFENRFAKSGGLAAVTTKILPYLKEVNKIPNVVLMTPFYQNISDITHLNSTGKNFTVSFNNKKINVEIFEYIWEYDHPLRGNLTEYYLKADGFFDSQNRVNDPYIYFEDDREKNNEAILKNALFYCKAVPFALKELGLIKNIIFHLQDWQTALISLTAKMAMLDGVLSSTGTVQTMHNSFDSLISWDYLAELIDKKRLLKLKKKYKKGITVFQTSLQLVDAPLNTVSDNFAKEFTTDILQTKHFAPHLQTIFKLNGVFGVNNGMFVDFAAEFSDNTNISIKEIKKIKLEKRTALLKILAEYQPEQRFGQLTYKGKSITKLPDDIPIFVMSGRLDPVQKGYDILLRALKKFQADEIKVILTPMAINESDLDYFYETAKATKGNLTVFPIRMQKGFHELQVGCTYGIMPSIYEPFGAAIEYMVNGTVNIARATGGLIDQIDHNKCGLLYKEDRTNYEIINIKKYSDSGEDVTMRDKNEWVQNMAAALYKAISSAMKLYKNHQEDYYKLIKHGFDKAKVYNWEVNAEKYFKVFNKVNKGF